MRIISQRKKQWWERRKKHFFFSFLSFSFVIVLKAIVIVILWRYSASNNPCPTFGQQNNTISVHPENCGQRLFTQFILLHATLYLFRKLYCLLLLFLSTSINLSGRGFVIFYALRSRGFRFFVFFFFAAYFLRFYSLQNHLIRSKSIIDQKSIFFIRHWINKDGVTKNRAERKKEKKKERKKERKKKRETHVRKIT